MEKKKYKYIARKKSKRVVAIEEISGAIVREVNKFMIDGGCMRFDPKICPGCGKTFRNIMRVVEKHFPDSKSKTV